MTTKQALFNTYTLNYSNNDCTYGSFNYSWKELKSKSKYELETLLWYEKDKENNYA